MEDSSQVSAPGAGLDPMIPKYLSPVDLLSGAAHAFDPRKLLFTTAMIAPLAMLTSLAIHWWKGFENNSEQVVLLVAMAAIILSGLTLILTILAYITRMQIEGQPCSLFDPLRYGASRLPLVLTLPSVMLAPALMAAGILRLLGGWQNNSESAAEWLNLLQVIPFFFAVATLVAPTATDPPGSTASRRRAASVCTSTTSP